MGLQSPRLGTSVAARFPDTTDLSNVEDQHRVLAAAIRYGDIPAAVDLDAVSYFNLARPAGPAERERRLVERWPKAGGPLSPG